MRDGRRIAHDVKDALFATDLAVLDALVHIEPAGELATKSSSDP